MSLATIYSERTSVATGERKLAVGPCEDGRIAEQDGGEPNCLGREDDPHIREHM